MPARANAKPAARKANSGTIDPSRARPPEVTGSTRGRANVGRTGNVASTRVTRAPTETRARILDAASAEFAAHGLGGARVDRIAAAAGANKRMLYYYFGNKDALFLAVLESTYESIRGAERELHLGDVPPSEAIRRLIEFTWRHYLAHPEFLSLLHTENLYRAVHLKRSTKVRSMHSPFVAMIGDILDRGVSEGSFRAGVDPVQLYISIAALAYFYLGNNYTLSAIFGRDLLSRCARAERLAHMTALVLGYLEQPDAKAAQ